MRRSVDVLLQLGAQPLDLCAEYLDQSAAPLASLMQDLEEGNVKSIEGVQFNEFVSNLCLLVATYTDLFTTPLKNSKLERSVLCAKTTFYVYVMSVFLQLRFSAIFCEEGILNWALVFL